jgi:glycosyltransferase involved in cell wall biosynthesis
MIAPSLWEGFPNSVAEALASGIPVGGFDDCEGIRDLIIDGENGWLVERTDPVESQINLLQKVYESRFEIEVYSESARKSVTGYQGEGPNEAWNQLATRLRFK